MSKEIKLPLFASAADADLHAVGLYLPCGYVEEIKASVLFGLPSFDACNPDDEWMVGAISQLGDPTLAVSRARASQPDGLVIWAINADSESVRHLAMCEEWFVYAQEDLARGLTWSGHSSVNITLQVSELLRWFFNKGFEAGVLSATEED
jgi:hypothetical protein